MIGVLVPAGRVRAWHLAVAEELLDAGVAVHLEPVAGRPTWGPDVDRLLRSDRRVHRRPARWTAPVAQDRLPWTGATGEHIDLVVDLSGRNFPPEVGRPGAWRLEFDGEPGELGAVRALLRGECPVVRVADAAGRTLAEGRPGSEAPGVLLAVLEDLLASAAALVVAAVRGHHPRLPAEPAAPSQPLLPARSPAARRRRSLALAVARHGYHALYRSPHWRVGWRFTDGPGVVETGTLAPGGWQDLPDDGQHFYADPFPVVTGGRTHLFVEDFEHRRGRGVISVVEFDERGPMGTPYPVLSHEAHLSYPCVLEDEGELWMIPETSAARTVELYRAVDYPDRWELEAVLLRDVDANDATPFRHDGRWWLAATVHGRGSCSDTLHLWYADRLTGPWRAHHGNPVLVDIASARPAGRLVHHGGRLLRPVQDGRRGYGAALAVAEVTRLDPAGFAQEVVARLAPDEGWPGTRLHTANRAGRLEVVDGSARSPRFRVGRHLGPPVGSRR